MSLGALTSVFTPASSCLASTNVWQVSTECGNIPCWYLFQGDLITSDCFPTSYNPSSTAFYSPGICPYGYTSACARTNTAGTVTETVQTCCPSVGPSFSCQTAAEPYWEFQSTLGCQSPYPGSTTVTATVTQAGIVSTAAPSITTLTVAATDAINAYAVEIRFQATDLHATSTIFITTSALPSTLPPSQANSSTLPPSQANSSRLSSGAIAGITVGAIIAVLAIIAAFWVGYTFRNKKARLSAPDLPLGMPEARTENKGIAEMQG